MHDRLVGCGVVFFWVFGGEDAPFLAGAWYVISARSLSSSILLVYLDSPFQYDL